MIREIKFTKEELDAREYESSDRMVCGKCNRWASIYRAINIDEDTGRAFSGDVIGSSCCNAPERVYDEDWEHSMYDTTDERDGLR